jgi:hypothetical protein
MKFILDKIKIFVLNRLREPSTWRGIVMVVTVFGVNLTPEEALAVASVGASIVAAIGIFTADKKKVEVIAVIESPREDVSHSGGYLNGPVE